MERRLTSTIGVHATDFEHQIEITLQNVLHREYTLRLFVENEERGLLTRDYRTWTPAQRPYVPYSLTGYTYWKAMHM